MFENIHLISNKFLNNQHVRWFSGLVKDKKNEQKLFQKGSTQCTAVFYSSTLTIKSQKSLFKMCCATP